MGLRAGILAIAIGVGLGGCGKAGGGHAGAAKKSVAEGFAVGLLLPENKTTRYEAFDLPAVTRALAAACPKCTVAAQNAEQDASRQQAQADALLSQGVQVIILDAVDTRSAAAIVARARSQGVPVIAYDRLAGGPVAGYVTFDAERIGREQGKALLEAVRSGGDPHRGVIVMINGSITDSNSAPLKRGAHAVLDGQVEIGFEVDTPDWSPDKAQQEMEQALTKLGAEHIIGVYSANDGMASGIIAALRGRGVSPLPPVTGQDSELAAIQRVVAGDQFMTVHARYQDEADAAVAMAIAAATGQPIAGTTTTTNDSGEIPTVLLPVFPVTRATVASTVVRDGIYTVAQICTEAIAPACAAAGLR
jgi:D-xylose transport system substrate-binding protein